MSQGGIDGLGKDARVHGFDGKWLTKSELASFEGNRGNNGIYIVDDVTLAILEHQCTGYMMESVFALVPGHGSLYLHEVNRVPDNLKPLVQELKALIKGKSYDDLRPIMLTIEDKLHSLNQSIKGEWKEYEDEGIIG